MKIYNILIDNKKVASFTERTKAEEFINNFNSNIEVKIEKVETITKYFDNVIILDKAVKLYDFEEIKTQIKKIIEKDGGKIINQEFLGLKKLAYEIKKNKEAFYITTRFQIEFEETKQQRETNETISELEKYFRFNADIIKFLTISISKDEIA